MSQYPEYWFKPKSHGFGASPQNWKGWTVTLASVELLITYVMLFALVDATRGPGVAQIGIWLALVALTTLGFAWFAIRKTQGDWRWGRRKRNNET